MHILIRLPIILVALICLSVCLLLVALSLTERKFIFVFRSVTRKYVVTNTTSSKILNVQGIREGQTKSNLETEHICGHNLFSAYPSKL